MIDEINYRQSKPGRCGPASVLFSLKNLGKDVRLNEDEEDRIAENVMSYNGRGMLFSKAGHYISKNYDGLETNLVHKTDVSERRLERMVSSFGLDVLREYKNARSTAVSNGVKSINVSNNSDLINEVKKTLDNDDSVFIASTKPYSKDNLHSIVYTNHNNDDGKFDFYDPADASLNKRSENRLIAHSKMNLFEWGLSITKKQ